MRVLNLVFVSAFIPLLSGVLADQPAQIPICHKCEENKVPPPPPPPPPAIPRCGKGALRPRPRGGECVVTYSCSGNCGNVAIPHLNSKSMECDYAEVTVGPDGSIIDQCCDPPECPSSCPTKPGSTDQCFNDMYGCPAIDGTIQRFGGKDYIYHCHSGFCATTISSVSTTNTLSECAEKCSRDPACKMLSHNGKTCTLATKVGSIEKGPGSVVLEPINGPKPPQSNDDCSKIDNTRHTIHGMEFLLRCNTRVTDPATCKPHPASSYEECANLCATDTNCASASFSAGHCCISDKKPSASKQPGSIGLEPLPGYGCPYVDWAVKDIGGVRYEYHCDAWLTSGGQWTLVPSSNDMNCALQCSKNKQCTGISLRGNQCYIATAPISLQPKGDWVALVPVTGGGGGNGGNGGGGGGTEEKGLSVPECKEAHGHEVKYKGHVYKVDCYRWVGGDGFKTATMHKLADCIKMCADHSNCVALHYLPHQQFCAIHDNIPRVGTQGDFGVAYVKRIS
ncbi:hypothetical protein P175DRAFT_0340767 [Aspergillus ochraceoroseus IBT 24754]|uniref:Apple domain-containing protein n=2 Tax=Aspergillus ochraceoroseus TaxID=138278 RepID=A0A2T5LRQ5_9EURO|nr:uncharacterized protein P175DRAFT_0340767 [Aspergillus ochraceoroseus IBT 24754]KKK19449.1 hypothetical protein AOCH_007489 [Aspergillus ochraceoroseus]PTU18951.1 hypothetical protein P175DRAFT_0340767 [Aspergillus ochraceoroseus IBT 24754]